MRIWRVVRIVIFLYVACSFVTAIFLAESAFHPQRKSLLKIPKPLNDHIRFANTVQDVSISSSDGIRLEGWYLHPLHENGKAVIHSSAFH